GCATSHPAGCRSRSSHRRPCARDGASHGLTGLSKQQAFHLRLDAISLGLAKLADTLPLIDAQQEPRQTFCVVALQAGAPIFSSFHPPPAFVKAFGASPIFLTLLFVCLRRREKRSGRVLPQLGFVGEDEPLPFNRRAD